MKVDLRLAALCVFFSVSVFAADNDFAPLEPAPATLRPLLVDHAFPKVPGVELRNFLRRSRLETVIGYQTPVKAQGRRGTCSIFSTLGLVESLYKMHHRHDLDISENYLEYLVQNRVKQVPSEGSHQNLNLTALTRLGAIPESVWPYEEYDWSSSNLPESEQARVDAECGNLRGTQLKGCLLGHMSPVNDRYRQQATEFYQSYQAYRFGYQSLGSQSQIRQLLDQNHPVILDVRFFYGAWNHRLMPEYGIGERDMNKWHRGLVNAPTAQDVQISSQHPAGHSIVIVGYDDAQRVYYFKNSWGNDSFGRDSDLLGQGTTGGYGAISYDYAHYYGNWWYVYRTQ